MIPEAEAGSGAFRRRAGAALIAATLSMAGAASARADLVFELGPSVSAGWTDNALNAPTNAATESDAFGALNVVARAHYRGQKMDQALGYRIGDTRYLRFPVLDTLTQELAWTSTYNLSGTLDLTLGATALLSRLTTYTFGNPALVAPQVQPNGNLEYLSTTANQGLTYTPTPRHHYIETFQVSRVKYLTGMLPETTYAGGVLHGAWDASRDTGTLELTLSDTYTQELAGLPAAAKGHRLFAQLLAGWKRDLSMTWSVDASLGYLIITDTSGSGFTAPAGVADLIYRRLSWFATLSVSQTTAPNIFIGSATLNDQAIARFTLPLNRSELLFVGGFASYSYARIADDSSHEKAFDLTSVGASLTARSQRSPLYGSLDYGFIDQHGTTSTILGDIPDRRRQVVLLTIGGSFDFGPGTPPLFQGVL